MVLVCSDFHFRNSGAFTTSAPFVRLQSIEALGLDNASYADGAWRRGDAERRAIVAGSGIPGPDYRRFRRALWGVVERCEARRVVIGGSGSMVDDKDWWGYRVSLYDGRRGAAVIDRPGVRVIQGIDLPGSMGANETPDLVLAQLEGSAPATLPRGLEHLALRLDEEIRLEGVEPGIAAYRPAELAPCRRRDAP